MKCVRFALCLGLWLWTSPADLAQQLRKADDLAARARAAEPAGKAAAVEKALAAYAALIALRPKDRKWVPKRASPKRREDKPVEVVCRRDSKCLNKHAHKNSHYHVYLRLILRK